MLTRSTTLAHVFAGTLTCTLACMFATPLTQARAQASGSTSIQVTATVVQPMTVTAVRPLDFGTVFAGNTKVVPSNDPKAAQVSIRGQGSAIVSITLTMPTSLSLGTTGTTLPVSGWNCIAGTTGAPVTFTGGTAAPVTMAIPNGANPTLTIGIGAAVTPGTTQASGDYTGTGQVAVAYTDY